MRAGARTEDRLPGKKNYLHLFHGLQPLSPGFNQFGLPAGHQVPCMLQMEFRYGFDAASPRCDLDRVPGVTLYVGFEGVGNIVVGVASMTWPQATPLS